MTGEVLLAGDRQMHSGKYLGALFLVAWGGLFGGIPLAMLFSSHGSLPAKALLILFPVIGFAAFLFGLAIALQREEVWFNESIDRIEVRKSFLGKVSLAPYARKLFDRVNLRAEVVKDDARRYKIALVGAGAAVPLGEFSDHDEARTAGMRAARRARVAFEEKPEGEPLIRMEAEELARVPAAELPQETPWWRRPATLALVAANFVPVWGVLYAGWQILSVMLLFWIENVIVGAYTLLKMLLARGGAEGGVSVALQMAGNLVTCAFFAFHYGMFCFVHGVFVVALFGGMKGFRGDLSDLPGVVLDLAGRHWAILAIIALVVSHGISFYVHYLKPRVYQDAQASRIMGEPYKRVVILHVVILLGGFAAQATGSSLVPLLMLIVLKTGVDLVAHWREHAMPHEREMRDYMAEHGHRFQVSIGRSAQ